MIKGFMSHRERGACRIALTCMCELTGGLLGSYAKFHATSALDAESERLVQDMLAKECTLQKDC